MTTTDTSEQPLIAATKMRLEEPIN
jgi:hypothetical protein